MDQRQVFLRDVLTVLFKRMTFIVVFAILVIIVVLVANILWPRTYESSMKVQIVRGQEMVAPETSVVSRSAQPIVQMTTADVNTMIQLVYSNEVLSGVARDVEIRANPVTQVFGGLIHAVQSVLRMREGGDDVSAEVEMLRNAIEVEPIKDSYTMEVTAQMPDPELAKQVLEAVWKHFKTKQIAVFSQEETYPFFQEQLERVKAQLNEAQEALKDYRATNNIVSLETEQDLIIEEYAKNQRLKEQLASSATAAQILIEGGMSASQDVIASLSQETESTVVTEIQLRLLEKILERSRLIQSLGPNHPQVVGINREIELATNDLKQAIAQVAAGTDAKLEEIKKRGDALNNTLAELNRLEQEVSIKSDSYEYYSEKVEEARVADAMSDQGISSVRLASEPTVPVVPIRPRPLFNLALALIGGLIGGIALAFFTEYLDHGLKTPEDVDYYVKVSPLASFWGSGADTFDPREAQRLVSMLHAQSPEARRFLEVCSSVGGEGAHKVARAIAEVYAIDRNTRTLFLDFVGDGLSERPAGRGIVDVLAGEVSLDEVMSNTGNLNIVGRGSRGDAPSYLSSAERLEALVQGLRDRFDRVVFHVAPVLQSGEAVSLAHVVDGVLLVIKSDSTRREVVQSAVAAFGDTRRKILGGVLTERKQVIPKSIYRRI